MPCTLMTVVRSCVDNEVMKSQEMLVRCMSTMQEAPASNKDTVKAEAALQEMQESQPALADVAPEQLSAMTAEDLGSSPEDAQDATAKLEVTQSVAAAAGFADEVTSSLISCA